MGAESMIVTVVLIVLGVLLLLGLILATASVRILREYERSVIFRLGRLLDQKGATPIKARPRAVMASMRSYQCSSLPQAYRPPGPAPSGDSQPGTGGLHQRLAATCSLTDHARSIRQVVAEPVGPRDVALAHFGEAPHRAGGTSERAWGDFDGMQYSNVSPRRIMLARKPEWPRACA
jgi:hypothetical protein